MAAGPEPETWNGAHLNALRSVAAAGAGPGGYEKAVEQAAVVIGAALEATCAISLLGGDRETMYPIGLHDPDPERQQRLDAAISTGFPVRTGVSGASVLQGTPVVANGLTEEQRRRRVPSSLVRFAQSSMLAVPLMMRGGPSGAVYCGRHGPGGAFSAGEVAFVSEAAALIRMRVELAFLYETLERVAEVATIPVDPQPSPPVDCVGGSDGLSAREEEILGLLALGFTNKEVGDRLFLSVRTIEWHRARIRWKLGVSSRAELIQAARAHGLVADDAD